MGAKSIIATIAVGALLAGCDPGQEADPWMPDQCKREEVFQACLSHTPAGPQTTKYNPWDEVINACETAAYRISLRPKSQIASACRSDNRMTNRG
jgi:nitrous oxide reductase accessory protein NosL